MCIRRNTFLYYRFSTVYFSNITSTFLWAISLEDSLFIISPRLNFVKYFFNFFQNLSTSFSLPSSDTTMSVYHTLTLLSSTFFSFYFLTAISVSLFDSLDSISSYSPFVNTFLQTFFIFLSTPFILPYIVFLFSFLILCFAVNILNIIKSR